LSHIYSSYRAVRANGVGERGEFTPKNGKKENPLFPEKAGKKSISLPKFVIPAGVAIIAVLLLLFSLLLPFSLLFKGFVN
jgi:hypothetical protein